MIDAELIRHYLDVILDTEEFRRSRHRSDLLRYIVEQALTGQSEKLKGYSIGVDVFGRGDDFDPRTDPIVRIEALRLRNALDNYYSAAGQNDPVRIVLRKGNYVPRFELADARQPDHLKPATGSNHWFPLSIITALVLVAGVLIGFALDEAIPSLGWSKDQDVKTGASAQRQVSGPVVIVLPFEDISNSPETREMAFGLTSEVVRLLSQFKEFQVLPLRGRKALDEASASARKLDDGAIGYILEGSVSLNGDRLRVSANLKAYQSGTIAWAEKYDRGFAVASIYSVQEDIATNVVKKLGGPFGLIRNVSAMRLANSSPPSLRAYECVLRTYDYRRSFRPEQHAVVRACLETAVQTDPNYTHAWALLAYIYADEERFRFNVRRSDADAMARSLAAAERAVRLNPYDVLSHQALSVAHFHSGNIPQALEAASKAVELNPNNQEARIQLGFRTAFAHDWEAGVEIIREAMARSVDPPGWFHFPLAVYYFAAGDYEQARLEVEKAAALDSIFFDATRAAIYGHLGRQAEAAAWLEKCRRQPRFDELAPEFFRTWQFKQADLDRFLDGLKLAGWQPVIDAEDQTAD